MRLKDASYQGCRDAPTGWGRERSARFRLDTAALGEYIAPLLSKIRARKRAVSRLKLDREWQRRAKSVLTQDSHSRRHEWLLQRFKP